MWSDTRFQRAGGVLAAALVGCTVSSLAAPPRACAQDASDLVDGIVAVVDDTVVSMSELQEYVITLVETQNIKLPDDPAQRLEFYRQALDQKVNEVVLFVHAKKQGITVPDAQVEDMVEQRMAYFRRRFGSELEFQQALASAGMTQAEFRINLTEQARTEAITRSFLQQRVSDLQPIPVSEDEIVDLFEAQKRALGPKPATVTLEQVIIKPQPSEEARLAAQEKAEQALSRARAGEDFARLAREYSDDATRSEGGNLGWVQKGQLLPEFEQALYAMRPGQISDIVQTSVGLHIIKLERVRGNERLASHILIRPEITDADVDRARALAEEVASALRVGADIDSLINQHHNPSEASSLTKVPLDQLPADYRAAVQGAGEGEIVGPVELTSAGPLPAQFAVAKILGTNAGGEWTLDDVRERFRQQIQQNKMIERVVQNLRDSTYIDLREDMLDALAATPTG